MMDLGPMWYQTCQNWAMYASYRIILDSEASVLGLLLDGGQAAGNARHSRSS